VALKDVLERAERLLTDFPPESTPPIEFLGAQYDAGLAWVQFGAGYGGLGMSGHLQRPIDERLHAAGAPICMALNPVGYGHGAGVVHAHGTAAQKGRWLRPLFTCEDVWCQLFSEPGAGSDLAGLSTLAERDGDEWIVNGQKVWSSGARHAAWGILLARTDPTAPKHRGLTFFVLDMTTPGVEVRPIREMTGGEHFNETFFSDVRIPDDCRLGEVGMGWAVSVTTLMYERVLVTDASSDSSVIDPALEMWETTAHDGRPRDAVMRDRLLRLWVRVRATELLNQRAKQLRVAGQPGADGSLGKLAHTRAVVDSARLAIDLMGPGGLVDYDYSARGGRFGAQPDMSAQHRFALSPSQTIQGGTSEIMLNVIGERILGLPGDVRVDKERPWNEVPRS
jgi:alkylation response protein AidB-like acyl-CoA dehydrogenase